MYNRKCTGAYINIGLADTFYISGCMQTYLFNAQMW